MKRFVISKFNSIILAIIALLGFSCDTDTIDRVEYGMPTADFKVNGTIVDKISQEKLSNIRVVFRDALSSAINEDTTYSDENGNYEVQLTTYPSASSFLVRFEDIDGAENGAYLEGDSIVDFSDEEFQGGDGSWYSGEKSKEIDMKLSPDETKND